jgi:hypothetical protein
MLRTPTEVCIDGVQLDRFLAGHEYDVGTALGTVFLTEHWAELVLAPGPALAIPLNALDVGLSPPNLVHELTPPYYDGPPITLEPRRLPRLRYSRR